jgi:hypothetical protein
MVDLQKRRHQILQIFFKNSISFFFFFFLKKKKNFKTPMYYLPLGANHPKDAVFQDSISLGAWVLSRGLVWWILIGPLHLVTTTSCTNPEYCLAI